MFQWHDKDDKEQFKNYIEALKGTGKTSETIDNKLANLVNILW